MKYEQDYGAYPALDFKVGKVFDPSSSQSTKCGQIRKKSKNITLKKRKGKNSVYFPSTLSFMFFFQKDRKSKIHVINLNIIWVVFSQQLEEKIFTRPIILVCPKYARCEPACSVKHSANFCSLASNNLTHCSVNVQISITYKYRH